MEIPITTHTLEAQASVSKALTDITKELESTHGRKLLGLILHEDTGAFMQQYLEDQGHRAANSCLCNGEIC